MIPSFCHPPPHFMQLTLGFMLFPHVFDEGHTFAYNVVEVGFTCSISCGMLRKNAVIKKISILAVRESSLLPLARLHSISPG